MHNRFTHALQPTSQTVFIAKSNCKIKNENLSTNIKKYKFSRKSIKIYETYLIQPPTAIYIICVVSCNKRNICKIKINTNQQIRTVMFYLQTKFSANAELSFLQIKNVIFANSNFFEESKSYVYRKPDEKLCAFNLYPTMCMYFYDGTNKNYDIKIDMIVYDDNDDGDFVELEQCERNVTCRACLRNTSTKVVTENPIVPYEKRFLCTSCFNELFIDEKGESKYKDMQYVDI